MASDLGLRDWLRDRCFCMATHRLPRETDHRTSTCEREYICITSWSSESRFTAKEHVDEYGVLGRKHQLPTYHCRPQPAESFLILAEQHGSDFATACSRLLDEVLKTAGLLDQNTNQVLRPCKLIDLGIGCGEQTIFLAQTYPALLGSYVGITIDPVQCSFAERRLSSLDMFCRPEAGIPDLCERKIQVDQYNFSTPAKQDLTPPPPSQESAEKSGLFKSAKQERISIFCADAAQPSRWDGALKTATKQSQVNLSPSKIQSHQSKPATWILALDTLYHFRPSRQPLFNHAFQELEGSVMVFDLLLADEVSARDRFLVRIFVTLMSCPMGNFVTKAEYRAQLIEAGYIDDKIEMKDISHHVFDGLADFIETRDSVLNMYIGKGVGAYRVFGWVLRWWARTGIIRGIIVVAKR